VAGSRFITNPQGYLGRAPTEAVKGDIIAVLLGGTVPFLLRKDGDYCRIIGDFNVHGTMDGELFELDPTIETLVIE
jgi:hypothetical protein